jgi:hypothetical protein
MAETKAGKRSSDKSYAVDLDAHRRVGSADEPCEEAVGEVGAGGQTDRPLGGGAQLRSAAVESVGDVHGSFRERQQRSTPLGR